jgi:hypothetical protein
MSYAIPNNVTTQAFIFCYMSFLILSYIKYMGNMYLVLVYAIPDFGVYQVTVFIWHMTCTFRGVLCLIDYSDVFCAGQGLDRTPSLYVMLLKQQCLSASGTDHRDEEAFRYER